MSALTGFRISPQQTAAWQQNQQPGRQDQATWLQLELAQSPDEASLRERLQALAAREEILRTRLEALPGMALPIQVIADDGEIPLTVTDWRDLSAAEQASAWRELQRGPAGEQPLRVWLVQTAEARWRMLLKADVSLLDLPSLWLLARELGGEAAPEERLQYVDYAEWKHGLLEEDPDNPGLAFWRQQRQAMTAPLLPGLEKGAQEGATTPPTAPTVVPLEAGLTLDDLQRRAGALGIAPEEYLFAAWCLLVARLRGQTRLQLAWIDDGRGEGLEDALGLFEQALPVEAEIDPARPMGAQLDDLLAPLRSAQGWHDYYDSGQACDLAFAYRRLAAADATTIPTAAYSSDRRAGLGLDCLVVGGAGHPEHLHCRLAYDGSRFGEAAVACLAEQWQRLLAGLADPSVAVGAIGLRGDQQQRRLTPPMAPDIEPVSLPTLIERQALNQPDAPALADGNGQLSYRELSARSNQLARYLQEAGMRPGDVIGVLLPRGNPMIVAIIAVLKAGGAYLPLDPDYPAERLAYMVQDSGVQLVLSAQAQQGGLPDGVRALLLDDDADGWPRLADDGLAPVTDLQGPAYLIYTSGSTGQPKAVEITHANLSHSTQVRMAFYDEPVTAYLLLSSFAFDSSVAGIFWTLAQGGLLVLPASGEELDLARLTTLIGRHRISHGLSLPSLYETLLDYGDRDGFASLATWIVAGEPCRPQVLAKHRTKAPQARLVNEYGPTEATVWATAEVLSDSADDDIGIGRPIPGMRLWLLNDAGVPAAIGEPGEIQLGGPTLSPGYHGRPEQTAQAFVASPAIAAGARRYRTGDLAHWRLDGRLSFLGRVDHQVKIRGYRVELGEIERLLTGHSEVREAVVIAQELADGKRLVAYVTDRHGYAPEARSLSDFLNARLPSYMVPSAFVHLKALPRTPNGKVDVQALPEPDSRGTSTSEFVAPRNEMETELAAICAEVLHRERVGVLDSFFEIGGDSILSLQIVARANQRGIRLTAKQVFECETVARMAEVATRLETATPTAPEDAAGDASRSSTGVDLSLAGLDDDGFQDLLAELNSAD